MFKEIVACRICGNVDLLEIVDLGNQALTGIFPKSSDEEVPKMPLRLVKCSGNDSCGLLQLKHTYDLNAMYGNNYGYRSSLNNSMVKHLENVYEKIIERRVLNKGDLIIDIGSNDGTLLRFYDKHCYRLVGIDPSADKFKEYYPREVKIIPDFFTSGKIKEYYGDFKAKVITSIAMFYDLEDPAFFVRNISETIHENGVWVFEQSYMPLMVDNNAYDTICHEHIEYYGMKQIKFLLDKYGFKIIDFELNDINGGSIKVTASKTGIECKEKLSRLLEKEEEFNSEIRLEKFAQDIRAHKNELTSLLKDIKSKGKLVCGYGASTKGNVVLQYCGLTINEIPFIAEVNEDKFGSFTPGTCIPIISETEAKQRNPDYFLVLPWHFKEGIIEREKAFIQSGGKIIFPLPELKIVDNQ